VSNQGVVLRRDIVLWQCINQLHYSCTAPAQKSRFFPARIKTIIDIVAVLGSEESLC
jgi:hypothetical protein